MMNNKEKYKQAFSVLHASEHISLEDIMSEKRSYRQRSKVVAAVVCTVILLGSGSVYAANHYLNPSQIVDEISADSALSKAFADKDAITINETQTSNGYNITLLGLVSGEKLGLYVPDETKKEVSDKHSYAALAISKSDGSKMSNSNFCVSPLINGEAFTDVNAATLNVGLSWFEKDGVIYELIECDNLEIFADRGVYLSLVDDFGDEVAAFRMDEATGKYHKVKDYAGTSALFTLPLDKDKADTMAADKFLVSLRREADSETDGERAAVGVAVGDASDEAISYINEKAQALVDSITEDNLKEYFVLDESRPIFTARPDEKGWIDFGTAYVEDCDWTVNGGSGYLTDWLADDEDFNVVSTVVSSDDETRTDMSTLEITVVFRNDDGSFTEATYRIRDDKVENLK
ncbi:MAG: hypothetical protein UEY91_10655 [Lachnospiraceae bacterium]|nr:hypothetical protein [Lachnospiraceae bacterium]